MGVPFRIRKITFLDSHNQPVPIGVPGELCIGGAGVTSGYLNRPELTADKFFEYAIDSDPPTYLYRTGDLARYLPDGNIEFLGRIDQQVKIRGFRIELGEIESVFDQHSAIHNAVVVIREDRPDNKRIIAYVVLKPNSDVTIDELQVFLRKKLPEYMVPSNIIFLEMLPLMENGKVDRKALPAPKQLKTGNAEDHVAPTDSSRISTCKTLGKALRCESDRHNR